MAQRTSLRAVTHNLLLQPRSWGMAVEKVWRRLAEYPRRGEAAAAERWCREAAEPVEGFANRLSPQLWDDSVAFDAAFQKTAAEKLRQIRVTLGGGGDCRLLYFLVRYLKPGVVVETGVAAGYSSQSVLSALAANGAGHLFSSDLPYWRLEQPERYVGLLVDDALKDRWSLYLQGDRKSLAAIMARTDRADIIHYDSDKSRAGRTTALRLLKPCIGEQTVIVMDDIEDNLFFRDYVVDTKRAWRVFAYENKYVGLVGL